MWWAKKRCLKRLLWVLILDSGMSSHGYVLDSLLITTISRTTSTPITVQIHIPQPIHPFV